MNDISKKLKRLRNEDFIWIVYFFIVVFALYSNKLDRDYLLKKDNEAYKREKYINITIFFIAFFIYLYFLFPIPIYLIFPIFQLLFIISCAD